MSSGSRSSVRYTRAASRTHLKRTNLITGIMLGGILPMRHISEGRQLARKTYEPTPGEGLDDDKPLFGPYEKEKKP